jgi:hypothetical protein
MSSKKCVDNVPWMVPEQRAVAAAGNKTAGHVAFVEEVKAYKLVATDHL